MSLVSNEGEGEQNEIRNLQDKLNSTMKLVSHLTSQLNELKEQVLNVIKTGMLQLTPHCIKKPSALTRIDTQQEQEAEPAHSYLTMDTIQRALLALLQGVKNTRVMCFLIPPHQLEPDSWRVLADA